MYSTLLQKNPENVNVTLKKRFCPNVLSELIYILDEGSSSPKAPPRDRRRDRSATRSSTSNLSSTLGSEGIKQQQPISHGLPPTPKVHMGACFSKVPTLLLA